jgi:hypothetical protein
MKSDPYFKFIVVIVLLGLLAAFLPSKAGTSSVGAPKSGPAPIAVTASPTHSGHG